METRPRAEVFIMIDKIKNLHMLAKMENRPAVTTVELERHELIRLMQDAIYTGVYADLDKSLQYLILTIAKNTEEQNVTLFKSRSYKVMGVRLFYKQEQNDES